MWSIDQAACAPLVAACLLMAGCRVDMQDQPRYEAYESSAFFEDGAAMRRAPAETELRARDEEDPLAYAGKSRLDPEAPEGSAVRQRVPRDVASATTTPMPITRQLLDRGHDLFETYCAACHGLTGEGDGMVARRGFQRPPSYHEPRLREAPVGHFIDVITNGWGAMPSYGYLVAPEDRWAVAAYVRTLQLSRAMSLEAVPEPLRREVTAQPQEERQR